MYFFIRLNEVGKFKHFVFPLRFVRKIGLGSG